MLKKKISKSRKLAALPSDSERMFYTWLNSHLDIEGRISADPDVLKGEIVPRLKHWTPEKVQETLTILASIGLIILYEWKDDIYLELIRFKDEQHLRPDREKASEIGSPQEGKILITPGELPELSGQPPAQVKLREDKLIKDMQVSPALLFPLKDGTEYPLELAKISEYEKTYHNIDVQFELKKCLQWDIDRPEQRKTGKGILKHINHWLSVASQSKGPGLQPGIQHDNTAVNEMNRELEKITPELRAKNKAMIAKLAGGATKKI